MEYHTATSGETLTVPTTSSDVATSTTPTLLHNIRDLVFGQWPSWLTSQYVVICVALLSAFCSCLYGLLHEENDAGSNPSEPPPLSPIIVLSPYRRARRRRSRRRSGRDDDDVRTWLLVRRSDESLVGTFELSTFPN
ncbi:hypothetical protein IscW_ISCW002817 [Ixodes scapularis]|uniref:Uncharacterized protein n=1 Tax=Ixodes scapularis TaxID=6945 RepID=B7PC39_IXOSC|nr:hypothetical protein IscW_ISCW002817 [Ixodes scapularis]|eukprot:XP_002409321.1 hypothetical protein IscW_ISCW002817 [Ixodes scapularis]